MIRHLLYTSPSWMHSPILRMSHTSLDPTLIASYDYTSTLPANHTFARSSTATDVVNGTLTSFATGVPRLNPLGVLIEGQRTNLAKNNGLGGLLTGTTRQTGVADPLGGTQAIGVLEDSASSVHSAANTVSSISYTSGTKYGYSAFVKRGHRRYVQLFMSITVCPTATPYANFDLDTATVKASETTALQPFIKALNGGWYLIGYSFVAGATSTNSCYTCTLVTGLETRAPAFTGAGSGAGVAYYVWGHQVEALYGVSSYVPTTAAAETRAADALSITDPSTIPYAAGRITFTARTAPFHQSGTDVQTLFSFGNATEGVVVAKNASGHLVVTSTGFTSGVALDAGAVGRDTEITVSIAWAAGSWTLTLNGTDTTGSGNVFSSALTYANVGKAVTGSEWFGRVKTMKVYTNAPSSLFSADFTGVTFPAGITFSRSSTALDYQSGALSTYATNAPRFGPLGVLCEGAKTTARCGILNTASGYSGVTLTNGVTDPVGGTAASTIIASSTGTSSRYAETIVSGSTFPSGDDTHSLYIKPIGGARYVQLFGPFGGNNFYCNFDLSGAGAVGTMYYATNARITAVGDGGYIISCVPNETSSISFLRIALIGSLTDGRIAAASLTAGDGVLVYAMNAVNAFGATSLIPGNTGAAATRAAELMSLTTPTVVPSGTGRIKLTARTASFTPPSGSPDGTDDQALFMLLQSDGSLHYLFRDESGNIKAKLGATVVTVTAVADDTDVTAEFAWNSSGWTVTVNGTTVTHSGDIMSANAMTTVTVGSQNYWRYWNGRIKTFEVYAS